MRALIRYFPRLLLVARVLLSHVFLPYAFRRARGAEGARRARTALEKLGGPWIKLGQALALRFDLLPAAYCHEFLKLLSEVPPFPFGDAREVIRRELDGYPEQVFSAFDREPFAAASIGQVYRAVLPTGETVAVKVQRPGIDRAFRADIELMYVISTLLGWLRIFGGTNAHDVIDEFARWTANELDYRLEGQQGDRLRANAQGDALERDARVYWRYSTRRVLTTEYLDGIPLLHVLRAVRSRDRSFLEDFRDAGYDLEAIVRHVDWNMFNQMHVDGYFHADLHPANLLVLPGNVIGYVDFGIVGQLSEELRESLTQYTWLLYQGESERAIGELLRWVQASDRTDPVAGRADLVRAHEEFLDHVRQPGTAAAHRAVADCALDVLSAIRRNNMVLAPAIVAYLKTLLTADTLRFQLAPDYDLPRHVEDFFGRIVLEQVTEFFDPRRLARFAYTYGFRLRRVLDRWEGDQQFVDTLAAFATDIQQGVDAARRRLVLFALLALAGAAGLLLVLQPSTAGFFAPVRAVLPNPGWLAPAFVAVVILAGLALALQAQQLRRPARRAATLRALAGGRERRTYRRRVRFDT